jgi:hypothetical protein
MATHFNDIQAALLTRLGTLSGSTPIAYPNIEYEPSFGTEYLNAQFLPAGTNQVTLGATGKDENVGIFQIDVVSPTGDGRSIKSDSIADHFARGSTFTYNGISVRIRSVTIAPALLSEAWYITPVSINYYTYTGAR